MNEGTLMTVKLMTFADGCTQGLLTTEAEIMLPVYTMSINSAQSLGGCLSREIVNRDIEVIKVQDRVFEVGTPIMPRYNERVVRLPREIINEILYKPLKKCKKLGKISGMVNLRVEVSH